MGPVETILTSLAASTAAIGVIAFLIQSLLKHFLSKDIESHKITLEKNAKQSIEDYKSELERERLKLQIAYGGIFAKQADTIMELYQLLAQLERQMQLSVHAESEGREYKEFIEIWRKLMELYNERKILLTKEIDEGFENIVSSIFYSVQDYKMVNNRIDNFSERLTEAQFDRLFEKEDKALEVMNSIPSLKEDLTNALREVIGVHHSPKL